MHATRNPDSSRFSGFVRQFNRWLDNLVGQAPVSPEERNRLQHYTVFLILGIPTMLIFGLYNLLKAQYVLCLFITISAVGLSLGWVLLGRIGKGLAIYRMNSLLFGMLLICMLVLGGDGGSKILWMYTYPLIVFFLLGKKEGAVWCAGILLLSMVLLLAPLPWPKVFSYPPNFIIRFLTTFVITSAMAFWFELLRQRYRLGMEAEQQKLEREKTLLEAEVRERKRAEAEKEELIGKLQTALEEVKVLSGMIPICSKCHKIRDDQGFWDQLETYLHKHSGAKFSYGICPECIGILYPEVEIPDEDEPASGR